MRDLILLLFSSLILIWKINSLKIPQICAVYPRNSLSFFKSKPYNDDVKWSSVLPHINEKLKWDDEDIDLISISLENIANAPQADICVLLGITEKEHLQSITNSQLFQNAKAVIPKECSSLIHEKTERFGIFNPNDSFEPINKFIDNLLFKNSERATLRQVYDISEEVWNRQSADDLTFVMQCWVDAFTDTDIKAVRSVTSTDVTGLEELKCMCGNCAKQMADCFSNPKCRACLDCLNNCKGNDQVCSYRCITSYETDSFEKFALCILQKNNCMGNSAVMPTTPDPRPITMFRGQPLTHETAEHILEGWLDTPGEGRNNALIRREEMDGVAVPGWSWKVVCGQNPAYDYFSCQHQIFYREEGKSAFWYDPVFKVTTLDGEDVWRRRHYRVRKADDPGTFNFSVLDNGVVSNEYWRILDCADDLSWIVLYYCGAASAAGTNYRGALLCSKDGTWPKVDPDSVDMQRITAAFDQGGIKLWELFNVDNTDCLGNCKAGPAPLGHKGEFVN